MIPRYVSSVRHSTVRPQRLKAVLGVLTGLLAAAAPAQSRPTDGNPGLRDELTRLLRDGSPGAAVRQAQRALRERPGDPGTRAEYVYLHLALARHWLATRQYDACLVAVEAVLAVEPDDESAHDLRREIERARGEIDERIQQVDVLLRLELFEAALERTRALRQSHHDVAQTLKPLEAAAWLGAADDHYLARNFPEAFVLYEQVLTLDARAPADVCSRWAIALALALAETGPADPADAAAAGRLLARAIDVLRQTNEPVVGQIVGGLLAERAGQWLDAARSYSGALGVPWELPPADRRRECAAQLRAQAITRVRELYQATPTRRRDGMWAIALAGVWKQRTTPHFDVYAHSDVLAERVTEALEYHHARVAAWLGVGSRETWEPRWEIRVHATQQELHDATGTGGITYAVSHTRLQGPRVLARRLEVFQADPWLLSATLPHELTHAVLTDALRQAVPPLAIDEGLALQAEPPARRLMYRRLLRGDPPDPIALLSTHTLPADLESFYVRCDALTGWLLDRIANLPAPTTRPSVIAQLLASLPPQIDAQWWRAFGWQREAEMQTDWQAWVTARGQPPRMPPMILTEPAAQHRRKVEVGPERGVP